MDIESRLNSFDPQVRKEALLEAKKMIDEGKIAVAHKEANGKTGKKCSRQKNAPARRRASYIQFRAAGGDAGKAGIPAGASGCLPEYFWKNVQSSGDQHPLWHGGFSEAGR